MGDSALRVSHNWYTDEFLVDLVDVDEADEPGAANELSIDLSTGDCNSGYVMETLAAGDRVHFLVESYDYSGDKALQNRLVTIDGSDPDGPKIVGDAELDVELYYWYDAFVRGAASSAVAAGDALVFNVYDGEWAEDGYRTLGSGLYVVDPSDPEEPRVTYRDLPAGDGASGLLASGSIVARSHFEVSEDDESEGRFYLDRVDVGDPRKPRILPPVNVPGAVVALDGDRALVVDFRYVTKHNVTEKACFED